MIGRPRFRDLQCHIVALFDKRSRQTNGSANPTRLALFSIPVKLASKIGQLGRMVSLFPTRLPAPYRRKPAIGRPTIGHGARRGNTFWLEDF